MNIPPFDFQTLDWDRVKKEEHAGETGIAYWQVQMLEDIRVRIVEYSSGYKADHWCSKGHIIFCIEGEMMTELSETPRGEGGREVKLSKGMCYLVGDNTGSHRTSTITGCKLFIVD